jgi:hypothetical protein
MTTYLAKKVVTSSDIPAKTAVNTVLYQVDGVVTPNLLITDPILGTSYTAITGIAWGAPTLFTSDVTGTVALSTEWADDVTAKDLPGSKHSILITQQAVAYAGVTSVKAIDIDNRRLNGEYYWTRTAWNAAITTVINGVTIKPEERIEGVVLPFPTNGVYTDILAWKTAGYVEFKEPFKNSVRIHFSKNGGFADPLLTLNAPSRATATFSDCTYATGIYYLNRDDPQFNGNIPALQFYVEGMAVPYVRKTGDVYDIPEGTSSYSNNPARCLLDYLLNTKYGKGLAVTQLDLKSFYDAAFICDQVMVDAVPNQGPFYAGGTHNVKRYECNLALDSSKSIRDNINILLGTMQDANLIWSGGKYKLTLAAPNLWGISGSVSTLV